MNAYIEIKNSFQYLDCAVRNNQNLGRCSLPKQLQGRNSEAILRDYVFCLTLVSFVAQLESDIDKFSGVPSLKATDKLKPRLRALKSHFSVPDDLFNAVDRIRDARNLFIHDGQLTVDTGCSRAEMPGKIVSFLQRCQHPDYI